MRKSCKFSTYIALLLFFCSLTLAFELTEEKLGAQPILYNCTSTFPYQITKIATLINESFDKFGKNYTNQAIYIKKGAEDDVAGGTWEVVIIYNVSAKSMLDI